MIKVSMEQTTYTVPRECVSRVATLYLLVGMTRRICNKKKGGGGGPFSKRLCRV